MKFRLTVQAGQVIDASDAFLAITEFTMEELKSAFHTVWHDLLRIQLDEAMLGDASETYFFTKRLEVKKARVRRHSCQQMTQYDFDIQYDFDLANRLPYIDHLFFNGITGVAIYSAPDMTLLKANQIYLNFLDEPYRQANHSIGRPIHSIVSGFAGSEIEKQFLTLLQTGKAFYVKELTHIGYKRGTTYWDTTSVPIYEYGEIKYIVQTADEITEVMRNKQQLEEQSATIRQQKLELEAIIKHSSNAICVFEKNGTISLMNEEAQRGLPITGIGDALTCATLYSLSGEKLSEDQSPISRALKGETVKNFKMIVRAPGYESVFDSSAVPVLNEENQVSKVIASFHNITELMEHRNNLERLVNERTRELSIAHEELNNILESVTDGFFALNKDWEIVYVNRHFCRMIGKEREDILHRKLEELYSGSDSYRIELAELNQAMEERTPVTFEGCGFLGNGFFEIRAYPYHDGICVFQKDITEQKKYEQELKRLSQLNLIGQLAAGISHEIRNPMTAVRGFLQLLHKNHEFSNYKDTFGLMIDELDRANAIVSEFLSMGSVKLNEQKMQNINTIVTDIVPLIQADALRQGYLLELDIKNTPDLMLNHNEIRQLILNLCRNGFEAMTLGKKLTISTYSDHEHVMLAVKDEGNGINPDIMDRVGTPFFTTKDNGTGLGLGVCHGIAARHNAALEISSGSKGTTVLVKFKIDALPDL